MNRLEADSIRLSFNNRNILSDIYLHCETGDVTGIIGRNGAGKSSLMKIVFGSMAAENQSVRIDGVYQKRLFKKKAAINYLPQDNFLMDYLTLNELIRMFRPDPDIMDVPGLSEIKLIRLGELSSGQKRLIEIAIVLFSPTMFTILDEPFSFLSPKLAETISPYIKQQSKKKGIIISDHQYRSVFRVCHKFYVLADEQLREIRSLSDLEKFHYLPKSAEAVDTEQ